MEISLMGKVTIPATIENLPHGSAFSESAPKRCQQELNSTAGASLRASRIASGDFVHEPSGPGGRLI